MESIKEIYKIGHGPSSSHTMGPKKAAERFLTRNNIADRFEVILYGSLAATGIGHLTDHAIKETFQQQQVEIIWQAKTFLPKHPNALNFKAFDIKTNDLDYHSDGLTEVFLGHRFDGKNHNWLIIGEYLCLPFSYMSFVIKEEIEKG